MQIHNYDTKIYSNLSTACSHLNNVAIRIVTQIEVVHLNGDVHGY